MPSRLTSPSPAPRLYLVMPPVADAADLRRPLVAALDAADIAALLLALAPTDERTMINRVKALAPSVQDKAVALLLDSQPDIVARAGADGVHVAGIATLADTIAAFKPDRIVGVGNLRRDTTPCSPARQASTTSCSASPTPPAGGRPSPRSSSASTGGPNCLKCRAWVLPPRSMKSRRWRRPAPISSRSAIASGATRAARRRPSRKRREGWRRRPWHEHAPSVHDGVVSLPSASQRCCTAPDLAQAQNPARPPAKPAESRPPPSRRRPRRPRRRPQARPSPISPLALSARSLSHRVQARHPARRRARRRAGDDASSANCTPTGSASSATIRRRWSGIGSPPTAAIAKRCSR